MASSPLLLVLFLCLSYTLIDAQSFDGFNQFNSNFNSDFSNPHNPVPPSLVCDSTPHPNFCRSILNQQPFGNLYDYGRFTLAQSLFEASMFSNRITTYLFLRPSLSPETVGALEDCKVLADDNVDFLMTTSFKVKVTSTLQDPEADKLQGLLSALLTNTQTCLDGLRASTSPFGFENAIFAPLLNDNMMYSVSLSLFSQAWVPEKNRNQMDDRFVPGRAPDDSTLHPDRIPRLDELGLKRRRKLLFHEAQIGSNGDIPLRMSRPNRRMFEFIGGRKLLQSSDPILVNDIVVVSQLEGFGKFSTIGDAVDSAPNKTKAANGYYLIYVMSGVYEEYVVVPKYKRYIMMIGEGINRTVITGNHSVVDGWTTYNSPTMIVQGEGFVAVNITIRNTAGPIKHQAVAMRSSADLSSFYRCSFEGYQDTLYAHSLRQFYRECDIYGTVDFIFGNAAVVFQSCNIYSRLPMERQKNTITAQGRTDPNQNTGISMQNCTFLGTPDLLNDTGSTQTYLGRPWKLYSRTMIMQSFMDGTIHPSGWLPWDGDFALDTLYYAEYNNTGEGADTINRITWPGYHVIDNITDAINFTVTNFVVGDDWLPQTGVPYLSGML